MSLANPYQIPQSNLDYQGQETYSEVKPFSVSGRIGRVRFFGYIMVFSLLIYVPFIVLGLVLAAVGVPKAVLMDMVGIGYVVVMVLNFMLAIQRAHDFNRSGWMALLVFIPLLNIIFWVLPGTDGENRFGKKTPPNPGWLVWLMMISLILGLVGIFAAIALPAYKGYLHKAQMAAHSNMPAPVNQFK